MALRAARNFGGTPPAGSARRKRGMGAHDIQGSWSVENGLMGAMLRRQATGGRRRVGGRRTGLGPTEILNAKGEFRKRVRRQLEGVPELITELRKALTSGDHAALVSAVLAVRAKLVEGSSAPFDLQTGQSSSRSGGSGGGGGAGSVGWNDGGAVDGRYLGHRHGDDEDDDPFHSSSYRQVRRLDREAFVALGGPDLLLEVLRRPGTPADARLISPTVVTRDTTVWGMALMILRELCFTDQDLSERLGSSELILYLLTMMAYSGVFDQAVGLVEEILAVKSNTYFLGEVPRLHSLIENMSSQQLAHFSRVLALLVFEPEYRQLMESAHVLRSMELLQLRRDRVVRADSIIDKNQALILSAPNLLPRLMELLRVMNFNPPLAMFDERALELQDAHVAHVRISLIPGSERPNHQQQVAGDWAYLAELRAAVDTAPNSNPRHISVQGIPVQGILRQGRGPENQQRRRSNEPNRIVNFFRSFFRRNPQPLEHTGANTDGSAALAATGYEVQGGRGGVQGAPERGATAAEPSAGTVERVQAAVDRIRAAAALMAEQNHPPGTPVGGAGGFSDGFGGGGLGGGVDLAPGLGDGVQFDAGTIDGASFILRDFLSFLQPSLGGSDPEARMATLEQELAWPLASTAMLNGVPRRRLEHPTADQAREELQLNGLMLAPHQVEVLFVLCTLLGARRKGEAHQTLAKLGLIDVLNAMFERLSWGTPSRQEGPHGANCDCNPESALRVQYLRLVHNFLDRDSNNNPLKRLLLSQHERQLFATGRFMRNPNRSGNVVFVKHGTSESEAQPPFTWRGRKFSGVEGESQEDRAKWVDTRGLLSKIVDVFMKEPMESLYRFWLASCVEAFLRGGSTQEQLFIAGGGLLPHLVNEITSEGVWCAGSLQTAFDLLGELCKGNKEVLEMLEACMTQKQLRRFLEVMVDNLVDSNVFMRSLVLSVEHSGFRHGFRESATSPRVVTGRPAAAAKAVRTRTALTAGYERPPWEGEQAEDQAAFEAQGRAGSGDDDVGNTEGLPEDEVCYLGHTWYDVQPREVDLSWGVEKEQTDFSYVKTWGASADTTSEVARVVRGDESTASAGRYGGGSYYDAGEEETKEEDCGHEELEEEEIHPSGNRFAEAELSAWPPQTGAAGGQAEQQRVGGGFTRLQGFLKQNTPQLVRDLMGVVNLETINHENICCLNTAVLILIFADRRGQLAELLENVRQLPAGRGISKGETEILSGLGMDTEELLTENNDSEDLRQPSPLDLSRNRHHHNHHRFPSDPDEDGRETLPQDGATVLRGFRRLLWFWSEYYLRGGRDRLSLEFSTHVKFWAWKRVIRLLCADDGSPTALVDEPPRLPRSPFDAVAACTPDHSR